MKFIEKLSSRKFWLLILLTGFCMGVVDAQNADVKSSISYEQKLNDLSLFSDNAANLFEQLVDGAPNAVFFRKEQDELLPGEYVRPGGEVSALYAEGYPQILDLLDAFPQHANTIQLIQMKWDGRSGLFSDQKNALIKQLGTMENLEFFLIQMEENSNAKMNSAPADLRNEADHLQKLFMQNEMHESIEIIYRILQPAQ